MDLGPPGTEEPSGSGIPNPQGAGDTRTGGATRRKKKKKRRGPRGPAQLPPAERPLLGALSNALVTPNYFHRKPVRCDTPHCEFPLGHLVVGIHTKQGLREALLAAGITDEVVENWEACTLKEEAAKARSAGRAIIDGVRLRLKATKPTKGPEGDEHWQAAGASCQDLASLEEGRAHLREAVRLEQQFTVTVRGVYDSLPEFARAALFPNRYFAPDRLVPATLPEDDWVIRVLGVDSRVLIQRAGTPAVATPRPESPSGQSAVSSQGETAGLLEVMNISSDPPAGDGLRPSSGDTPGASPRPTLKSCLRGSGTGVPSKRSRQGSGEGS